MRSVTWYSTPLFLLVVAFALRPLIVQAHADYERSDPSAGAVISEAPAEVHVWFTQELFRREGANSLEVYGPDEGRVDQGDGRIDDDDRSHMVVSLKAALLPGVYTVRWQTLSAEDGDTDSGEFAFTVNPAATPMTPEATVTATPTEVAPTPTPQPAATGTPAAQSGGGMHVCGLAVGLVAIGMAALGRQRQPGRR